MKRIFVMCALLGTFAIASALTAFSKTFNETYKVEKGSALDKAACMVCHLGAKGGKLNPYGLDVQKEMKIEKQKAVNKQVLTKVEQLDSDKDGVKNIDEIKKDTNPGSKPQ